MRRLLLGNNNLGGRIFDPTPAIDMDFASTKTLVDQTSKRQLTTFVRSTTGTFFDATGVLRSAPINLIAQSEELNDAAWTALGITITPNVALAPSNLITAELLEVTSSGGSKYLYQPVSGLTASQNYAISFYCKANASTTVVIGALSGSWLGLYSFTLSGAGSVSAITAGVSGTITSVGNGWYRCGLVVTTTGTGFDLLLYPNATSNVIGDSIYAWGAQLEQSSTVNDYVQTTTAANSGPRFDHNPATLESLGLLIEESRTNSIRNNTMVGAVAGTPGTLPTNWSYAVAGSGLTRSIVGTGIENGISYIDIRVNGTATSNTAISIGIDRATAVTGQSWTSSAFFKLAGGSTSGIVSWNLLIGEADINNNFITGADYPVPTPTSNLVRTAVTRVLSGGASTAFADTAIRIFCTNGAAIDFTIRIGLPQLEQGSFATSVIQTSGTALTRSADVCSITGTNFDLLRANLFTFSEEFDNANWSKLEITVSPNTILEPTGTLTADTITETTATSQHNINQSISITGVKTFSVFAKQASGTRLFRMIDFNPTNGAQGETYFNLTNGTVVSGSGKIVDAGNGWYRCSIQSQTTVTSTYYLSLAQNSFTFTYTGDGTSGVYIWGAQLERGAAVTDYIQTTTASVTSFDACSIDIEAAGLMNNDISGNRTFVSISDGTYNNLAMIVKGAGQPEWRCEIYSGGGAAQSAQVSTTYTRGSFSRVAIAAALNNTNSCFQGVLGTLDTSCLMPVNPNRIEFRDPTGNSAGHPTGYIKRVQFWPLRLGNSNLQRVTL